MKTTHRISLILLTALWGSSLNAATPFNPSAAGVNLNSNLKADITTKGMIIESSVLGNGMHILQSKNAIAVRNGKCIFNMVYHMINVGQVKTSPGFDNKLLDNGQLVIGHKNQQLLSNQFKQHSFPVALSPGAHTMTLHLDLGNVVAESKENNNTLVKKFNVVGSCGGLPFRSAPR